MFTINSMQILYREAAFMQSIVTHQTKVKLVVNNDQTYQSSLSPVKQRLSVWNSSALPTISVPGGSNTYNLQFIFYKNNQEIGRSKCLAVIGRNKKDCLDVANRNFSIVGKFLYQIIWRSGQPQQIYNYNPNLLIAQTFNAVVPRNQNQSQSNMYPRLDSVYVQPQPYQNNQYLQQPSNKSEYVPPNMNKKYFNNNYYNESNTNQSEKVKPKKKKEKGVLEGMFGGCFGCGMARNRKKKPFFANQPLVMDPSQLPYAPPDNPDPFSIQYYSKRFGQKYKV